MNLKILGNKIKANQPQYDLDREAAKISALSSKELEKHEYLIAEDLGFKPGVVGKAKFEYSTLDETFNKLLKKIINIEKSINTATIWSMILCVTLINIVCLNLIKYHQLTLNLIH